MLEKIIKLLKLFIFLFVYFFKNFFKKREQVILFAGAVSGSSFPIARRLYKLGYSIVLVSPTKKLPEYFLSKSHIVADYNDSNVVNDIYAQVCNMELIGVLVGSGEQYLPFASKLAQKLDLVSIDFEAAKASTDKSYVVAKLGNVNNKRVIDVQTETGKLKDCTYEGILKPVDGAGNDGVVAFENGLQAYEYWIKKGSTKHCIYEEWIKGDQFDLEGVSFNGRHSVYAITLEKYKKYNIHRTSTHWFLFEPPIKEEIRQSLKVYAKKFLDAIGVTNGAWHIEMVRTKRGEIFWIDYANRIGGSFEEVMEYSSGIPFMTNYIACMVGKPEEMTLAEKKNVLRFYIQNKEEEDFFRDISVKYNCQIFYCTFLKGDDIFDRVGFIAMYEIHADSYKELISILRDVHNLESNQSVPFITDSIFAESVL
ncbi:MAG: hypothetical protein CSA42_01520 [Gammaproteobacteria bacterium]|nr:MAG: hypothetical protein CSA42_01520 [Gammaproteobacteria bacterium]